jgi:hypothetical protein
MGKEEVLNVAAVGVVEPTEEPIQVRDTVTTQKGSGSRTGRRLEL